MAIYAPRAAPAAIVDALRGADEVIVGDGLSGPEFLAARDRITAMLTFVSDRVDADLLKALPQLRIVANVAVGVDNIDRAACAARGVIVTNTPGVLTEATADLAFALLLATARRVAEGDRFVRAGRWQNWQPDLLLGVPVHGGTLGILGLGRIGQAVARRARGFGMHVLYHQRRQLDGNLERALGATFVSLDDLFASSDFLSLHCPLTPETFHIVSAPRLARMKPSAIVINTTRGGCVDEAALLAALTAGTIRAAGLDVFENEPQVLPGLLSLEQIVLSPHIGSAETATRFAMARLAADNVLAVLGGKPPLTPV